jgi:hypothetical protein
MQAKTLRGERMKKSVKYLAAAALMAIGAGSANADIVVQSTKTTVGANDVYIFKALNNASTGSTKVLAINITLTSNQPIKFENADIDGDGELDANVNGLQGGAFGVTASPLPATLPGSYIRLGTTTAWKLAANTPDAYTDLDADGSPDPDPDGAGPKLGAAGRQQYYANTKTFRVEGFVQGGVTANVNAAQFAGVIVPAGATVSISGTLADENGVLFPAAVPEPASLGLLGLGALGLLRRNRKA